MNASTENAPKSTFPNFLECPSCRVLFAQLFILLDGPYNLFLDINPSLLLNLIHGVKNQITPFAYQCSNKFLHYVLI